MPLFAAKQYYKSVLSVLALSTALVAADAVAQSVALEEIIVTARKRSENLQDIPLSITAFTATAIDRKNIQDLKDVARFTAGLAFEDYSGGFGIAVIRGQSQVRTTALEQPVATFLNGVYLPRSYMVNLGVTNLERIEVVKGPQSSRYGRNAFSGAINYISPSPNLNELQAKASSTYGNDGRYDAGAAISFPIVEDLLALRVSYDHTEFGGSWENTHPNANVGINPGTNGNVGGYNTEAYSASLLFTPLENLRIEASYNGFDRDDEAAATRWLNSDLGQGNCGTFFDFGGTLPGFGGFRLFCGSFGVVSDTVTQEPRAYGQQSETDIGSVKIDWDITDAFSLGYLYGHAEATTKSVFTTEPDQVNCGGIFNANGPFSVFGTLCNFQGGPNGSVNYDSHEIRLSFDDGSPITGAVGGYYSDGEDRTISTSINLVPLGTAPAFNDGINSVFPDNIIFGRNLNLTKARGAFGEVEYQFPNNATRISAELRYTSEKLRADDINSGASFEQTYNFVTPRVTLEHDLRQDVLLYATVARGAKAGGFNASAFDPDNIPFDPEFNWTYEVGAKSSFWDNRAVLNSAVFYTTWSAMQINAADPDDPNAFSRSLTLNLGDSTIYGIELEGSYLLTENITFDGTASWVSSTFDDGTIDQQYAAFSGIRPPSCDGIVCNPSGDIGGNDLPRTPNFKASFGGEWRDDLNMNDGEYFIRTDMSYQEKYFADTINASSSPGRFLVNARAGVSFENIDLSVWVRNLADKKYVTSSLQIVQGGNSNIFGTYLGERRTFGVTAKLRY